MAKGLTVAQTLGLDGSFDYEGRTYFLAPEEWEFIALWERYIQGKAWESLKLAKKTLPEDIYKDQCSILHQDIAAGLYAYISPPSLKARFTMEGLIEFVSLRMGLCHCPELCSADQKQPKEPVMSMGEIRKLAREIITKDVETAAKVQQELDALDRDPNPRSPASKPGESTASTAQPQSSPMTPGT